MKGYKVFDQNWRCKDFKYEIGKTYKTDKKIVLCKEGFHFCEKLVDCFNYYEFNPNNKVAIIEARNDIIKGDDKHVTNEIEIIKELTWHEVLDIVNVGKDNTGYSNSGHSNSGHWNSGDSNSGHSNSGDRNSGDWNSGYRNSGDRNSGYWNSGYWNSGQGNSGDWNSSNYETGFFNSRQSNIINVFNKPCERKVWEESKKPDFIFFNVTQWVSESDMTEREKEDNPNCKTAGGYLKTLEYKEAWRLAYESATQEDIELLKALPNFDVDVFEEISGIRVD